MTEVSSFLESFDESAGTSEAAFVLVQARQTCEQAIVKAFELASFLAIQPVEIQSH
jgi:hypothetical protein